MTALAASPSRPFAEQPPPRSSSMLADAGQAAAALPPPLRLPRGHDSADLHVCPEIAPAPPPAASSSSSPALAPPPPSDDPSGPFEGPEKLLELWFAPAPDALPAAALRRSFALTQQPRPRAGLRAIERARWEGMLDLVSCKVLSVLDGDECDAYLLSESSMFVFPHKLILKTCGTTTLLLGLERILRLAHEALGLVLPAGVGAEAPVVAEREADDDEDAAFRALGAIVKSTFYSRKSFMFPERQKGPHRDWMLEVAVLDRYLDAGAAYTVGKMNGDHWLLYMAAAPDAPRAPAGAPHAVSLLSKLDTAIERPLALPSPLGLQSGSDQTLEVLMTHLSPASCSRFSYPATLAMPDGATGSRGHVLGAQTSDVLGLSTLFPASQLDAFAFEPCGYSANALVPASAGNGAGYWTVHVTPEEGSSYASFETNVEVRAAEASSDSASLDGALELGTASKKAIRSFEGLVARVVAIFEPGRLSVTLFTSTSRSRDDEGDDGASTDPPTADTATDGTSTLNASILDAGSVLHALELPGYRRTDRIAYEFEDYDLTFVSFDRTGSRLPRR